MIMLKKFENISTGFKIAVFVSAFQVESAVFDCDYRLVSERLVLFRPFKVWMLILQVLAITLAVFMWAFTRILSAAHFLLA